MWAFRWECVIRTYFALERFLDVKDTWKRSNTKVRWCVCASVHSQPPPAPWL